MCTNCQCGISQLYIIVLHIQDVETVVGDISGGIQQHKNLSDVTLVGCCDELTRGVVEGLTDHKCISKLILRGETVPPSKIFQMYLTYLALSLDYLGESEWVPHIRLQQ